MKKKKTTRGGTVKKYEHGGSTPSSYNRRYEHGGPVRGVGCARKQTPLRKNG